MRIKKSSGWITLACVTCSWIWLLLKNQWSISKFADCLFLWALFFLIIGGFLWVFASGFFDNFQYSMKKAFNKHQQDYLKLSVIGDQSYRFWVQPGLFLLFTSFIFLAISYLL